MNVQARNYNKRNNHSREPPMRRRPLSGHLRLAEKAVGEGFCQTDPNRCLTALSQTPRWSCATPTVDSQATRA